MSASLHRATTAELYERVLSLGIEGWRPSTKLLTLGNPKTSKNAKVGDYTAVMHLLPHTLSGHNVCPWASPGCAAACLHTAGNAQYMPAKTRARGARTDLFWRNRPLFLELLYREVCAHIKRSRKLKLYASVRLNGTSDLPWEAWGLMDRFDWQDVRFYDYTKSVKRALAQPYHLTFSRSECNDAECIEVLAHRGNVTVVVEGFGISAHPKPLPEYSAMFGTTYPVIDGDEHDARYLDRPGSIVALRAKGDAIGDTTGFVVPYNTFVS